jgi:hypothetical protein
VQQDAAAQYSAVHRCLKQYAGVTDCLCHTVRRFLGLYADVSDSILIFQTAYRYPKMNGIVSILVRRRLSEFICMLQTLKFLKM